MAWASFRYSMGKLSRTWLDLARLSKGTPHIDIVYDPTHRPHLAADSPQLEEDHPHFHWQLACWFSSVPCALCCDLQIFWRWLHTSRCILHENYYCLSLRLALSSYARDKAGPPGSTWVHQGMHGKHVKLAIQSW